MAIKELFYDQRPIALLDPRASQRIDPRFKFTRNSTGTYVDRDGILKTAEAGKPRYEYDYASGNFNGLLVEPSSTNIIRNSSELDNETRWVKEFVTVTANNAAAPDGTVTAEKITETNVFNRHYMYNETSGATSGTKYVMSAHFKRGNGRYVVLADRGDQAWHVMTFDFDTESVVHSVNTNFTGVRKLANGWFRLYFGATRTGSQSFYALSIAGAVDPGNLNVPSYQGDTSRHFYAWGAQVEIGTSLSSYIPTTSAGVTREADLLSVDSVSIPSNGSIYIDAQATSTAPNSSLISLKNASNQKINLAMEQRSETYNSLALINTYSGTAKSSLPLPVPTTNRERNIITWGANNYQYTKDSSRFAPSLSTSVPANLTSLSIGHDSVDPTKAFNGYINSVYLYSGEIAPAIAEALVRGELNPVNADTYSPSGPAGSLALVVNTQGASATGDKVFALPAESAANDNNLVITWGDGTESALELAAAEVGAAGLSHTYPSAGIYPVWVAGKMQNLYFNNSASAPDLLSIASWGTGQMFTSPSTMDSAFYGCSKLTSISTSGLPNTSAVTNWYRAFRECSSLAGTFPAFNFSGATNLQEAFRSCSSLTSFAAVGNQTQNATNFGQAWYGCSSLTSFPLIDTSSALYIDYAWAYCSQLTSFPLINTSNTIVMSYAWSSCTALASFPLINTSSCTAFRGSWEFCSSLTSFPLINTGSGTDFRAAWFNCSGLTSFPNLNTSKGIDFYTTWYQCSGLTSFPALNFSSANSLSQTWDGCSGLLSFPLIDTSSATTLYAAWYRCSNINNITNGGQATSFPAINTQNVTDFALAWRNCSSLAVFPSINTSKGTNFSGTWRGCSNLISFPTLNFSAVIALASDSINSFTGFREAWRSCSSLTTFPANMFNNTASTRFLDAFIGCALTAQSIENILVSINTANTSNGNLSLQGGTNAGASTWTANAVTAYNALVARGWTITRNA
jgi:uncharacterized protein (DUF1810 family)